jgi:RHS repeat-associated protein
MTDENGIAKVRYDYFPFGGELGTLNGRDTVLCGSTSCYPDGSETAFAVNQKFTGKERDYDSGLDYFGARYLSSAEGRFISADWSAIPQPVPYADFRDPQSLNLYAYVRNNPIRNRDIDGHCWPADDCVQKLDKMLDALRNKVAASSTNSNPAGAFVKTFAAGVTTDTAKLIASPLTMGTATGACMGGSGCSAGKTALAIGGDVLKGAAVAGGLTALAGRAAGALAGAAETTATGAENVVNGVRLSQQLAAQSAQSAFNAAGGLSQEAIAGAREIIPSAELGNPAIPSGFSKFSTGTFDSPSGPFQVHFYQNPTTGEVWTGLDYKTVFNNPIGN